MLKENTYYQVRDKKEDDVFNIVTQKQYESILMLKDSGNVDISWHDAIKNLDNGVWVLEDVGKRKERPKEEVDIVGIDLPVQQLQEYSMHRFIDKKTGSKFNGLTLSELSPVAVVRDGTDRRYSWNDVQINLHIGEWILEHVESTGNPKLKEIKQFSRYKVKDNLKDKLYTVMTRSETDPIMVAFTDENGEINVLTHDWSQVRGMLVSSSWVIVEQLSFM
ncbi:hypothetical protein COF68_05440 [Bacillus toyonensis]|uniref:hypothetical protein n=1 Tax=Bacillus toyonensis TaxID=155322 RepID=UPI000BFD0945|nr:hypothetical protein [Bacillus toyonensis]PHE64286.1 hypothetical protein COF68_05440 [Bacillus toyonensis]